MAYYNRDENQPSERPLGLDETDMNEQDKTAHENLRSASESHDEKLRIEKEQEQELNDGKPRSFFRKVYDRYLGRDIPHVYETTQQRYNQIKEKAQKLESKIDALEANKAELGVISKEVEYKGPILESASPDKKVSKTDYQELNTIIYNQNMKPETAKLIANVTDVESPAGREQAIAAIEELKKGALNEKELGYIHALNTKLNYEVRRDTLGAAGELIRKKGAKKYNSEQMRVFENTSRGIILDSESAQKAFRILEDLRKKGPILEDEQQLVEKAQDIIRKLGNLNVRGIPNNQVDSTSDGSRYVLPGQTESKFGSKEDDFVQEDSMDLTEADMPDVEVRSIPKATILKKDGTRKEANPKVEVEEPIIEEAEESTTDDSDDEPISPKEEEQLKEGWAKRAGKVDFYLGAMNPEGVFDSKAEYNAGTSFYEAEQIDDTNKYKVYVSRKASAVAPVLAFPGKNMDPLFDRLTDMHRSDNRILTVTPAIVEKDGDMYKLFKKGQLDFEGDNFGKVGALRQSLEKQQEKIDADKSDEDSEVENEVQQSTESTETTLDEQATEVTSGDDSVEAVENVETATVNPKPESLNTEEEFSYVQDIFKRYKDTKKNRYRNLPTLSSLNAKNVSRDMLQGIQELKAARELTKEEKDKIDVIEKNLRHQQKEQVFGEVAKFLKKENNSEAMEDWAIFESIQTEGISQEDANKALEVLESMRPTSIKDKNIRAEAEDIIREEAGLTKPKSTKQLNSRKGR